MHPLNRHSTKWGWLLRSRELRASGNQPGCAACGHEVSVSGTLIFLWIRSGTLTLSWTKPLRFGPRASHQLRAWGRGVRGSDELLAGHAVTQPQERTHSGIGKGVERTAPVTVSRRFVWGHPAGGREPP